DDGEVTHFLRLNQKQGLEEFVHRTKTTWEDHERFGVFDKHRLAHKEVMEINGDVEVWIWPLLKGKLNIAANRDIVTFLWTFVTSLHNSMATARDDANTGLCQYT